MPAHIAAPPNQTKAHTTTTNSKKKKQRTTSSTILKHDVVFSGLPSPRLARAHSTHAIQFKNRAAHCPALSAHHRIVEQNNNGWKLSLGQPYVRVHLAAVLLTCQSAGDRHRHRTTVSHYNIVCVRMCLLETEIISTFASD